MIHVTLIKWENDSRVTGTTASDRLESYSAAANEDEPGYQVVRPVECSKYTLNGVQGCSIIDSYTIPEVGKRFSMSVDATDASGVVYSRPEAKFLPRPLAIPSIALLLLYPYSNISSSSLLISSKL
jgi:hypothetical protein